TDPSLANGQTPLKATHLIELRKAILAVRTFAGLTPYSYTHEIAAGQPVRATDLQQMRTALAQARTAIGLYPSTVSDNPLTPNATIIKAMHIGEMRAGVN
ncbi:MAG TPA: hypothetical protein VFV49_01180, partial [Thermoanaerobaculia bacterium]|nr:hypothetical protein [Thermoanaerobaculia bacterium]